MQQLEPTPTHQQFCFNHSKFIFYIDKPEAKKAPIFRPNTTMTTRRKNSENRIMEMRKPLAKRQSKDNIKLNSNAKENIARIDNKESRRAKMQSISHRESFQKIRSRLQSKKKENSDRKQSPLSLKNHLGSPLRVKPLNLLKSKSELSQDIGKSSPIAEKSIVEKNNDKASLRPSFNQRDIRKILGEHHLLYREGEDFLTSKLVKSPQKMERTQTECISPAPSACRDELRNSSLMNMNINMNMNYEIERATILSYLKNVTAINRYKYFKYTKEGYKMNDKIEVDDFLRREIDLVKISPYLSMNIFPPCKNIVNSFGQRCLCREIVPFVEFLKALYHNSPEIINRLIEPPISNVYSVWLYQRNSSCFEPVFVDESFLIHHGKSYQTQSENTHCCTSGYPYLWLPIMMKAILKSLNTGRVKIKFGSKEMREIPVSLVYCMLTGLTMKKLELSDQLQLYPSKERYLAITGEGLPFYVEDQLRPHKKYDAFINSEDQIISCQQAFSFFNPCSGEKRIVRMDDLIGSGKIKIYQLPSSTHWFMYTLSTQSQSLTKYDLSTERNTQFILQHPSEEIRAYLYQQTEYSNHKTKLVLKIQGELASGGHGEPKTLSFRVKMGKYRLFLEQGQKRIHLLFNKKDLSGQNLSLHWGQQSQMNAMRTADICLQSSHEISLGLGETLKKNMNGLTEDSTFFYKNTQ